MKRTISILPFFFSAFFVAPLFSQQKNLPLNREFSLNEEIFRSQINSHRDTTYKTEDIAFGYNQSTTISYTIIDSSSCFKPIIFYYNRHNEKLKANTFFKSVGNKLKKENLIIVNDTADKFHLTIDPLFNFEYGRDQADSSRSFYKNTRGVLVRGDIGKQFSFETSFYENQATFVNYIRDFNNASLVVPGQGRWKKFKNNGYDFAMASGYISYSPSKHFNFQAGHGKHFVGDGYRSLLLSDNAFNYPFARITSTFGKVQYTNLYTSFMNLTDGGVKTPPGIESLFQKKAGNFQFLSWNIHKRVQLGFFQGLIWQASDSMNRECLKLSYASPIIYSAALSQGLKGRNNVLLGSTLKIKITNSISLYGQYMIDDSERSGIQAGLKYFDMFGIKNLHIQLEENNVTAYSYAATNPSQSYSHYNQPLAHPLGANFQESIVILNYRIGDFFTELKINYAITGTDHSGMNYGNSIFLSDTLNIPVVANNWNRTLRIIDFHLGYLVNPSTNFNIVLGISNRSSVSKIENSQTNFVYFGIRTSLTNTYYDF